MADPFRFAVATSSDPITILPRLTVACRALEERLERRCTGHLMVDYDELTRGAERREFDLMWLPPLIAARLREQELAHALALPVRQGRTAYSTAVFTRPDADIRTVEDLEGKSMAWVGPHSSAGYVLPRAMLRAHGHEPDRFLGEQHQLNSHAAVVKAVCAGEIDVGATFARLEGDEVVDAAWKKRDVKVIATYGPIPSDVLAHGPQLADEQRDVLVDLLAGRPDDPVAEGLVELFSCDAFTGPTPEHAASLQTLADGLDASRRA